MPRRRRVSGSLRERTGVSAGTLLASGRTVDSLDVPLLGACAATPRAASTGQALLLRLRVDRRVVVAACIVVWFAVVCAGLAALANHAHRPGTAGDPPGRWPASSRLEPVAGRATLVVGLHPGCPCSRATLEELDRLMARTDGRATVHALVFKPSTFGDDWEKTDIWRRAAAIPGVTVVRDDDGIEAARFGATTSGHVVVYDADGRLAFSGGITSARGHAGDSVGSDSIAVLLAGNGGSQISHRTAVFGCALEDLATRGEGAP
jgi:hypothetical protein